MVTFSDALGVRVKWALYRSDCVAGVEVSAHGDVIDDATSLGIKAYPDIATPIMIADVPQLVQAFHKGLWLASDIDSMNHCTGCNDYSGNPCPSHG